MEFYLLDIFSLVLYLIDLIFFNFTCFSFFNILQQFLFKIRPNKATEKFRIIIKYVTFPDLLNFVEMERFYINRNLYLLSNFSGLLDWLLCFSNNRIVWITDKLAQFHICIILTTFVFIFIWLIILIIERILAVLVSPYLFTCFSKSVDLLSLSFTVVFFDLVVIFCFNGYFLLSTYDHMIFAILKWFK